MIEEKIESPEDEDVLRAILRKVRKETIRGGLLIRSYNRSINSTVVSTPVTADRAVVMVLV